MDFKTILEAGNLESRRVLVRVDWNVPFEGKKVGDGYRIEKSLQTIKHLQDAGARVVLISHLDPPETDSMQHVYEYVKKLLKIDFCKDIVGGEAKKAVANLKDGEVLLLENLRLDEGEMNNSRDFALTLSSYGNIFVNEAFSESHREYSSIVGIPKLLPSFAGFHFTEEVQKLSKVFYPKRPFVFVLGGAKFETKLPLIEKFMHIADSIFVGGALAHNFFKEQGIEIGDSLVSQGEFNLKEELESGKVILPEDVVVMNGPEKRIDAVANLKTGDTIVDVGPNTLLKLKESLARASSVLWNGPLGNYELGYKQGTLELARMLEQSRAEVIVGGADTLSATKEINLFNKVYFISTGGGAMLDFLSAGTLPGIEALKR